MGGADLLFVLGVAALVIITLDGKRRIRKRAAVCPPAAMQIAQSQAALACSPARVLIQARDQITGPLTTLDPNATAQRPATPTGSLIGASLRIEGKVSAQEPLDIRGTIDGSVTVRQQSVMVATTGNVSRLIEARTIRVAGSVTGRLVAMDNAILLASARVNGSIDTTRLSCDAGARLKGVVSVSSR